MRSLVAILVGFMSVTTGGPLRCPCQLAGVVKHSAAPSKRVTTEPPLKHPPCGCKAHATKDDRPAEEKSPTPSEPCKHGPTLDLAVPVTGGERQHGGVDGGCGDAPLVGPPSADWPLCKTSSVPAPPGATTSPAAFLRYAHAFRC